MKLIITTLMLGTAIISCSIINFGWDSAYWDLYHQLKEKYQSNSESLSISIHVDSIYHSGDSIKLNIFFKNTSAAPFMLKKYAWIGDIYTGRDLRLLVIPPKEASITTIHTQTNYVNRIPDSTNFVLLKPGEIFTITRGINYWLESWFMDSTSEYGTKIQIVEGEYTLSCEYENYDFIPALADSADKKIWMGRVQSNTIKFRITE
jgi:hypothetical protein